MSPSSLKLKAFWGGMLLLRSPVWDDDDNDNGDGDVLATANFYLALTMCPASPECFVYIH